MGTKPVTVRTDKASAPPFLKGIPSQAGAEHKQYLGQEAEVSEAGLSPGLEELTV